MKSQGNFCSGEFDALAKTYNFRENTDVQRNSKLSYSYTCHVNVTELALNRNKQKGEVCVPTHNALRKFNIQALTCIYCIF